MSPKRLPSSQDLDVFSQQRFPEIAQRWFATRRLHHEASQALWAGMVATEFDDDELAILHTVGFFSPNDEALIVNAGRSFEFPEHPAPSRAGQEEADRG